ncbi:oxidoreductase [Aureimonas endophytica]|uniref:Oxidoreductase n=1 Tax=Aureimonas endophytica TaxID=2027858 RepID=A0A916ZLH7_9HYPH|nr:aldo/keto reductase [Aureimonas endophytica]GGE02344.1 oxidoreductase [Aureimonas endophytica]
MTRSPELTLNGGVRMPQIGLGVYLSPPEETGAAVRKAIGTGYRLIDTAAAYGNEQQVGEGIAQSGIARDELFVTTKLWISDYGYDPALRAFDVSMGKLGLETLDLYLLHWPTPSNFDATVAAYKAAERLLADGRVRAIGVCNFNPDHLDMLAERTEVVPAVNQVELHPLFRQSEVREANARRGIVTQAWSPIGGVYTNHPSDPEAVTRLLEHPVIVGIGEVHGRKPAQVVLRWHLQHGHSAIPKSVHAARIAENFDVFGFELSEADMAAIDGLGDGARGGPDPDAFDLDFLKRRAERA